MNDQDHCHRPDSPAGQTSTAGRAISLVQRRYGRQCRRRIGPAASIYGRKAAAEAIDRDMRGRRVAVVAGAPHVCDDFS